MGDENKKILSDFYKNKSNTHEFILVKNLKYKEIFNLLDVNKRPQIPVEFYVQHYKNLNISLEKQISVIEFIIDLVENKNLNFSHDKIKIHNLLKKTYNNNADVMIFFSIIKMYVYSLRFLETINLNDSFIKFKMPMGAVLDEKNQLVIHPGTTRLRFMQWLQIHKHRTIFTDILFIKPKKHFHQICNPFIFEYEKLSCEEYCNIYLNNTESNRQGFGNRHEFVHLEIGWEGDKFTKFLYQMKEEITSQDLKNFIDLDVSKDYEFRTWYGGIS